MKIMHRFLATIVVLVTAFLVLPAGSAAAQGALSGYIVSEGAPVSTGPSLDDPVIFRARKNERLVIMCETRAPDTGTLMFYIFIRGVRGWSASALHDDLSKTVPPCDRGGNVQV